MAAVAAGGLVGKGRDISLAALQRHDPYINRIVDVASQVALYTFGHRANEWEKTDVEGTLFVYTRSASPKHGFTIMNRLSMENRTEPITKDLDFQLQDPFLLYRNARLSIYGIWFYDKEECQRIAELMKNLTQYEQLKAHQGTGAGNSPMILNSGEGKEVDILRMLTKAKDEYTKCKTCSEPKQITSSSAIYDNPNLIKPIPVKPSENQQQRVPRPNQTLDSECQHLSLTALFGKQDKSPCQEAVGSPQTIHQQQQQPLPMRQGVVRSLSYEEPRRHSPPSEKQLCPAIQKLMVRSADLHPLSELPENRPCRNGSTHSAGEVFLGPVQPGSPHSVGTSQHVQSTSRTQSLLEKLQSAPRPANKYDPSTPAPASSAAPSLSTTVPTAAPGAPVKGLAAQAQVGYFNGSLTPQTLGHQTYGKEQPTHPRPTLPLSGNQTSSSGVISPQELLKKLQIVQQEQQLHASNRPALAAKFPVVTQSSRTGKALESWMDKTPSTEKQTPLFQATSPPHVPATLAPSLLMSPMVFTQPTCAPLKERDAGLLPLGSQEPAATSSSLLLPLPTQEPPVITSSPLTRLQLQEALLYLIQVSWFCFPER
ncbi:mRNA-decapping enzyme 1B isoform X2 [Canis lupus baileyi]|uniref:mRNA-decapping enzyme 1B isoform X2 n=1 Tax=Canis lupus familiaris TaxID=9615 RepID=UPI0006B3CFD2|nr:mRNA-decapping enzyme 1B isoform X2 [Canis lupus familiaris]XP_025317451.1 mRNA-decapping enzyme 1B isoform X2 [Canis lupus dingo]XP_038295427.1 mRNA-decapping enzyme 1B isoform X2 [Canis lupus familiaris]XP_038432241.1 mRNA-decapping enzyme 1B isoform X2 [Canis lupus familiaris]|eukprot:XP_013963777.1 mRNA-decapping enzyme 1B isoform X2 [Canis lupus familiaris]